MVGLREWRTTGWHLTRGQGTSVTFNQATPSISISIIQNIASAVTAPAEAAAKVGSAVASAARGGLYDGSTE